MRISILGWLVITFGLLGTVLGEEPKTIVLFDGKSLDDWEVHDAGGSGPVEVQDGSLVIGRGEPMTGVIYKKAAELPVTNYEICFEAQRVDGVDFFCGLTFPVGDLKTCASLIMGGWAGSVTGISSIDGLSAYENSTANLIYYKNKVWAKVKLQVTPQTIKVWLDGKMIIDVDIEGKKISVRDGPIESYVPLSFTTYETTGAIRNVVLRTIKPVAKP